MLWAKKKRDKNQPIKYPIYIDTCLVNSMKNCNVLIPICYLLLNSNNTIYANKDDNIADELNKQTMQGNLTTKKHEVNKDIKIYEEILKKFFNNLKSLVASFSQQATEIATNTKNGPHNGTIYILKDSRNPQMRIVYENGPIKDIIMQGKFISVINRGNSKKRTYSIKTTPIYDLLSGGKDFLKLKHIIIVNDSDITLNITHEKQNINIIFSIRRNNNDLEIDKLIAWTIEDGKTIINVGFDNKQYYINNNSKLPKDIFENKK